MSNHSNLSHIVLGIEILGNAIRISKEIRGIKIDERNMLKLSQYADETTAFLEDTESLSHLFGLLSQFESCSGLKINQSKSELLWLGSVYAIEKTPFKV